MEISILKDVEFEGSRNALSAKKKDLGSQMQRIH